MKYKFRLALILCAMMISLIASAYAVNNNSSACTVASGGVTCDGTFYEDQCENRNDGTSVADKRICRNEMPIKECQYLVSISQTQCLNSCTNGVCDAPKKIYVKLNEQFSLKKGQNAVVTDYQNMEITFASSVDLMCPAIGACPSVITLFVSLPNGLLNQIAPFQITSGTSKQAYDSNITFVSMVNGMANLLVKNIQAVPNDVCTPATGGVTCGGTFYGDYCEIHNDGKAFFDKRICRNEMPVKECQYLVSINQSQCANGCSNNKCNDLQNCKQSSQACGGNAAIQNDCCSGMNCYHNTVAGLNDNPGFCVPQTTSGCPDGTTQPVWIKEYAPLTIMGSTIELVDVVTDKCGLNIDGMTKWADTSLTADFGNVKVDVLKAVVAADKDHDKDLCQLCVKLKSDASNSCVDSDNGKSYDVKGSISYTPMSIGDNGYGTDSCMDSTKLKEFFCTSLNQPDSEFYNCPHGCANGACTSTFTDTAASICRVHNAFCSAGSSNCFTFGCIDRAKVCYDNKIIIIALNNQMGANQKIISIIPDVPNSCNMNDYSAGNEIVPAGETVLIKLICSNLNNNDAVRLNFTIRVQNPESGLENFLKGEIVDTADQECSANDCSDGSCTNNEPNPNGEDNSEVSQTEQTPQTAEEKNCDGCLKENTCLQFGTRLVDSSGKQVYCDISKGFKEQKNDTLDCQNNYECISNSCASGKCTDLAGELKETKSLVQRLLAWLRRLFGGGNN